MLSVRARSPRASMFSFLNSFFFDAVLPGNCMDFVDAKVTLCLYSKCASLETIISCSTCAMAILLNSIHSMCRSRNKNKNWFFEEFRFFFFADEKCTCVKNQRKNNRNHEHSLLYKFCWMLSKGGIVNCNKRSDISFFKSDSFTFSVHERRSCRSARASWHEHWTQNNHSMHVININVNFSFAPFFLFAGDNVAGANDENIMQKHIWNNYIKSNNSS